MDLITILRGLGGVALLLVIAYLFSNNKSKINWKLVLTGISIQFVFAILIIHNVALRNFFFPLGLLYDVVDTLGKGVVSLLNFTTEGSKFVFGSLATSTGEKSVGIIFAFQVLPTIIFVSTLTSVLYYLGILQMIVRGMAWFMAKLMGTSGAESLSNTANIFVGQTEAPLLIKPYIAKMTNSELLTIMVGGMATIAGGVMAAYIFLLGQSYADIKNISLEAAQLKFAVQLLAASTMAAPAGLAISKILFPETEVSETMGTVKLKVEKNASNIVEAAAVGAADGLKLAMNVAGMLLAFIALIAMLNAILVGIGDLTGLNQILMSNFNQPLSMQLFLGLILQFLAIGIGVPTPDILQFGSLLGTKIVLNEFVAYLDLTTIIKNGLMTEKGIMMATYALCGFANFSSIAIQIGGISPMAENRRADIAKLGLRAVLGGSLATLMTATIAGMIFQ